MEKVLIVSTGKYPNGNAGAIRQHAFAKLFELCGYSPFVIGLGESTGFEYKNYDGVSYTSFRAKNNNIFNRILNLLLFKKRLKKFMRNNTGFSKIMVVSIPQNALFYLKGYAKEKCIQLIHDSVEWYSPSQFTLGEKAYSYKVNNYYNTKWIDYSFSVVAISRFLEEHYKSRGIATTRIPVIMDINNIACDKNVDESKITVVYAGQYAKKDFLKEFFTGAAMLEEEYRKRLKICIMGGTVNMIIRELDISPEVIVTLGDSLKFLGRVSRETVMKNLHGADFTFLFRNSDERYAKAGFPTKLVESFASGTPMMLNLSSDIGDYVTDGKEAIICPTNNPMDIRDALLRCFALSSVEKAQMRKAARICAEKNFDYRHYKSALEEILK